MPATKRATNRLVAVALLASFEGLTDQMVATQLPDDNTTWAASGFVVVQGVGGTPQMDMGSRHPVVEVTAFAGSGSSSKPRWAQAAHLMEVVCAGLLARSGTHELLVLGTGMPRCWVDSAFAVSEPREVPQANTTTEAPYARMSMDVQINWRQETR